MSNCRIRVIRLINCAVQESTPWAWGFKRVTRHSPILEGYDAAVVAHTGLDEHLYRNTNYTNYISVVEDKFGVRSTRVACIHYFSFNVVGA